MCYYSFKKHMFYSRWGVTMSDLSFLAFCITVIAITAIARGDEKIAGKAISAITTAMGDFTTVLGKILVILKHRKTSSEGRNKSSDEREHTT
jgi:hypothetical protein